MTQEEKKALITRWIVAAAFMAVFWTVIIIVTGGRYHSNVSGLHYFLDMHDTSMVRAQREDTTTLENVKQALFKGADQNEVWGGPGSSMRVPPEGTVPRGYEPYPYEQAEIDLAGANLKNPLPLTQTVLERGKDRFETYCAVCHGMGGQGDGTVIPRMIQPPNLITGQSAGWQDGKIFHMITMGRGNMLPYAAPIRPADRWAIVHYVRLLQKKGAK
ncbi:MAG TPA: cytochrome c [Leptospiraceae bacterium]|nr:cytochrome c [Leptospirales bacterium]HMU82995.1 cytochrome c [Leptospiraceae bacterium]HMW60959.1 cytochrome c [Leptospiraceae bacterium]HMX55385.1 cytochrome c [Leptospiraceae bacterium]HMY46289.1 cytochrome c [Leptospiraceae bacterium]